MADVVNYLMSYLQGKSEVSAILGAGSECRIYNRRVKPGVPLPYVVLIGFEGFSSEHLDGISGIAQMRVAVECYAQTSSQAHLIAETIRLAPLQIFRGNWTSGANTLFINGVTSPQGYESGDNAPPNGGQATRYYYARDYFIIHEEATAQGSKIPIP